MASKVLNRLKAAPAKGPTEIGAEGTGDGQKHGTEEHVRRLAYLKWEAAGRPNGDGLCYWLEAERELRPA